MFKVNNLTANVKKYVVAHEVDGEFWYWGTFEEYGKAMQVACDINGVVIHNSEIAEEIAR